MSEKLKKEYKNHKGKFNKCIQCGKNFYIFPYRMKTNKWCSRKCYVDFTKIRPEISEKNHFNWQGGRCIDPRGYIKIYNPSHFYCDEYKYVYEHRLTVEKYIRRYLKPKEMIHHINKKKGDNRLKNLMCFKSNSAHQRFHKSPERIRIKEIIFDGRKIE